MRQTLLHPLFFLLLICVPTFGQTPFPFNETGYGNVMKQAKSENKSVLYMMYAAWCPHCHKMRDEVFADKEVSDLLQKNFLVAAQDVELEGGRDLARKFSVSSYPTFVVLDKDGNFLYGFNGELKKPDFIAELNEAKNPEKQLPYLKKNFGNDPSDGNKALALILALRKASLSANEVALKYLSTQKDEQLVNALNWKILANGVSEIESRPFQYVLSHQKEFASVSSEKRVARKIENIAMEALKNPAEKGDTIGYKKQRVLVKSIRMRKTDSLAYVYDKFLYEKVRDWKAYQNATIHSVDDFDAKNYSSLRNTAAVYLTEISDKEALKTAVKWSEKATSLQESKDGYLQTAKLYEKIGDKTKAIAAAQTAREFCIRVGFGTKDADELLKKLQSK